MAPVPQCCPECLTLVRAPPRGTLCGKKLCVDKVFMAMMKRAGQQWHACFAQTHEARGRTRCKFFLCIFYSIATSLTAPCFTYLPHIWQCSELEAKLSSSCPRSIEGREKKNKRRAAADKKPLGPDCFFFMDGTLAMWERASGEWET